ncbi:hypothetical protein EKH57_08990 [Halorubrum sp. BOL3-1]|uniref:hypothetical protein n=1 Tax=Halorubrum sp. BOL3-1 TaxID=2497325 RepID=UPI001004E4DA|nr:hypothetical protein [Halorubrum sp. BOL3-1]QAU12850.1 hypothetical protein EKH57_08990 [Halorubrum sp. BOL3-1]
MIGVGSLAAGGAAAMGTGATGSFTANDRQLSVDVVSEDSGVVAFKNTSPGNLVNSQGGELEIDFAQFGGEDGSQGVPIGSEIRVGNYHSNIQPGESGLSEDPEDAAFQIQNQWAGTDADLTLTFTPSEEFSVDRTDNDNPGSQLIFEFEPIVSDDDGENGGALVVDDLTAYSSGDGYSQASATTADKSFRPAMEPGEAYGVNVIVDTDSPASSTDDNLSGTLSVSVNPVE